MRGECAQHNHGRTRKSEQSKYEQGRCRDELGERGQELLHVVQQAVVDGRRIFAAQNMRRRMCGARVLQLTEAQADQRREREHEQHERARAAAEPS